MITHISSSSLPVSLCSSFISQPVRFTPLLIFCLDQFSSSHLFFLFIVSFFNVSAFSGLPLVLFCLYQFSSFHHFFLFRFLVSAFSGLSLVLFSHIFPFFHQFKLIFIFSSFLVVCLSSFSFPHFPFSHHCLS